MFYNCVTVDYYPKFTKESKVEKEQRYSTCINCWNDLEAQIKVRISEDNDFRNAAAVS